MACTLHVMTVPLNHITPHFLRGLCRETLALFSYFHSENRPISTLLNLLQIYLSFVAFDGRVPNSVRKISV
ncbi:hypothetical protein GOP47_0004346 [Adiantum capillus-veneris]|uniref:Uncharacterized protein n=1 Tax=Adiantum capillus-veneris TaxID=13818 RepID=A0A9D4V7Q1_ADICA|nr:hypothetical protein GOP47_0004346 [Adiantum capillus-veneris]